MASLLPAAAADAPLMTRFGLLTGAMVGLSLLNQALIHAYCTVLERAGVYRRTARPPTLGGRAQFAHSVVGWAANMAPLCFVEAAWPRPWDFSAPSVPAVCYGVLALMLALDFWCERVGAAAERGGVRWPVRLQRGPDDGTSQRGAATTRLPARLGRARARTGTITSTAGSTRTRRCSGSSTRCTTRPRAA